MFIIDRTNNINNNNYKKPIWEYIYTVDNHNSSDIYIILYKYPPFNAIWNLIKKSTKCFGNGIYYGMGYMEDDTDFDVVDYHQYKTI